MAQRHGKDTVVTIGGDDFSAHADNTEFADEYDMSETTTYGRKRKNYIQGLGDGTITTGGTYDDSVGGPGEIFQALIASGATVAFVFQISGAGTGKPQRTVDVKVSKYSTSSPVADKVAWSAELQMVGDEIDDTPQA
jgi:hypothetical protein